MRRKCTFFLGPTVALLFSASVISLWAEIKICLRPSGVQAVAWAKQHNKSAIEFAHKFESVGTWVYIRQLDLHARQVVENQVLLSDPQTAEFAAHNDSELATNQLIQLQANSPIWFIQSNDQTLQAGGKHLSGGLALEMRNEDEDGLFVSSVMSQLISLNPSIVIIDSQATVEESPFDPTKTIVLKINTALSPEPIRRADILRALLQASPDTVSVVDLMPRDKSEAQAWGYSALDSDAYAAAGRRFSTDLENYGYGASVSRPHSSAEFATALASANSQKKMLVVVAESSDDGASLRIPGRGDVIDATTGFPDGSDVIGLFCNSQRALQSGNDAAFVGTIYSDQVRNILRIALDQRPPATVSGYLNTAQGENEAQIPSSETDTVSGLFRAMSTAAGSIQSSPTSYGLGLVKLPLPTKLVAPTQSTQSPGTQPPGSPASVAGFVFFLVGALGGFLREFIRWKRLANAKRQDLYLKPRYLAISAVELCAAGFVALIFVNLSPTKSLDLPVCFVAGAAVELIVRQAARGSIWTPKVPHGPDAPRIASVMEYLRA
jgi:hypothetical protein